MTFGSVCDGIGCGHLGFEQAGMDCSWSFEIEAFPSAVLAYRFPSVPNYGDMTACADMIYQGKIEAPDVFIGGTPCFAKDHMVLTETGYVPIQDIRPGFRVMTHNGRLCEVVRSGSKTAKVGVLKACGLSDIRCTPEHPFLSVLFRNQNTRRNNVYAKIKHVGEPEWTEAKDMPGRQWCALRENSTDVPLPEPLPSCVTPEEAMYIAGFYLGDGWTRGWTGKHKRAVVFGVNENKLQKLLSHVKSVPLTACKDRTVYKVNLFRSEVAFWLERQFGRYSHAKTLPAWVLSHPLRGLLLEGYRDTDGNETSNGWKAISVSRSLAFGVRDLVQSLGSVGSIRFHKTKPTCVIEGRTVNQRDYWIVNAYENGCSIKSRTEAGYLLRAVTSFKPEGEDTVYNIEVEDDNSYILDGAVVHNCQAFSVAGKRKGLEDARGNLSLTFCEIADAIDDVRRGSGKPPCVILWENVPGVLSDKGNAFGCFLGQLSGEDEAISVAKWPRAGVVHGRRRRVAWCTLDSQYFGVAQRRRRIFVIAVPNELVERLGTRADPAEILSIGTSLRRDTPSRGKAGKGTSEDASGGAVKCGETIGALCARDYKTVGNQFVSEGKIFPVCMAHGQANAEIIKDQSPTLNCNHEQPIVACATKQVSQNISLGLANPLCTEDYKDPQVVCYENHAQDSRITEAGDISPAISAKAGTGGGNLPLIAFEPRFVRTSGGQPNDTGVHPCLRADENTGDGAPCVAIADVIHGDKDCNGKGWNADGTAYTLDTMATQGVCFGGDVARTLSARHDSSPCADRGMDVVATHSQVRRLTPTECERLQALPDCWTQIPWKGKPASECPDGPRYKGIGNGQTVSVMRWLAKRIRNEMENRKEVIP